MEHTMGYTFGAFGEIMWMLQLDSILVERVPELEINEESDHRYSGNKP